MNWQKWKRPEEILEYAKKIGRGPIRALYRWAVNYLRALLSADIEWRRGQEIRSKLLIQKPEFEKLQRAISETSEEEIAEIIVTGQLVGADVSHKFFHIESDTDGEIRVSFISAIDEAHTVELPKRYKAGLLAVIGHSLPFHGLLPTTAIPCYHALNNYPEHLVPFCWG